jgi:hypothetical protein
LWKIDIAWGLLSCLRPTPLTPFPLVYSIFHISRLQKQFCYDLAMYAYCSPTITSVEVAEPNFQWIPFYLMRASCPAHLCLTLIMNILNYILSLIDFKYFLPLLISVMRQVKPALSLYLFKKIFFIVNYAYALLKRIKCWKLRRSNAFENYVTTTFNSFLCKGWRKVLFIISVFFTSSYVDPLQN